MCVCVCVRKLNKFGAILQIVAKGKSLATKRGSKNDQDGGQKEEQSESGQDDQTTPKKAKGLKRLVTGTKTVSKKVRGNTTLHCPYLLVVPRRNVIHAHSFLVCSGCVESQKYHTAWQEQ